MSKPPERPTFDIALNVFLLIGVLGAALVQQSGIIPTDSTLALGLLYLGGAMVGFGLNAIWKWLRGRRDPS